MMMMIMMTIHTFFPVGRSVFGDEVVEPLIVALIESRLDLRLERKRKKQQDKKPRRKWR